MGKFFITESEKKHILELYSIKEVESENSTNTKDKWVSVNKSVEQRVTILDPTKYNNKIVFENLGFMLTILGIQGDEIFAGAKVAEGYAEDKERDGDRLKRYLGVNNFRFIAVVKIKINLSSSKEYQYTKLLNNKSLFTSVSSMSPLRSDEPFAKNIILDNVNNKNTSKIEFRNFPNKENPLNASFPVGSVTITDWYYNVSVDIDQDPTLNLLPTTIKIDSEEFELSDDDLSALGKAQKKYNKQYRKYRRAQKDLEDEQAKIPVELSSTKDLKSALNALTDKVFNLGGRMYQIGKAEAYNNEIILKSDLQKTNTSLEKPKFSGGEYNYYFPCGRDFIKTDTSKNIYKDVSYGNTTTDVNKNLVQDLKNYVCKYLG